jgi:hypothetical protein
MSVSKSQRAASEYIDTAIMRTPAFGAAIKGGQLQKRSFGTEARQL